MPETHPPLSYPSGATYGNLHHLESAKTTLLWLAAVPLPLAHCRLRLSSPRHDWLAAAAYLQSTHPAAAARLRRWAPRQRLDQVPGAETE